MKQGWVLLVFTRHSEETGSGAAFVTDMAIVYRIPRQCVQSLTHLTHSSIHPADRTMLLPDLCGLLDPGTYYLIRINVIHRSVWLLFPLQMI